VLDSLNVARAQFLVNAVDTRTRGVDATVNHTTAICHLGGASLDNEENYLIKKLFTLGLGMVCISNQARI
jgi:formate dehydrogenase major subunit